MSNTVHLQDLVARFTSQLETYQQTYNETQTRIDFINPLFTALGWDVNNEQGLTEASRPVVHEEVLRIGRATKMPDYSFRVGGIRKFFVEAKKPSINLKTDPEPAFQVRRYGWNAKLPVSIVTNFAELAVYDCRLKPSKNDKASTARLWYLRYTDYLKEWEKLVEYFSFEAVWYGSLDKYLAQQATPKGILTVDAAFLKEMEGWRERLAQNIVSLNPHLTSRQINFAVQQTIDRIIFLRIGEDRGIEDYGRLLTLTNGPQIYPRLFQLFHQADQRYNSGLFHFRAETKRGDPDNLTPTLRIDDAELTAILKHLYYPDSPYEFSVFPADILGQVYEQFLGKVIRLTATREAVVEEKPEVKKAGGVYYTPTYIVDYIVKQTVGKLVEGKTVDEVSHLTILDPACGSGSFLLGAYQFLLSWHLEQYLISPEKWAKGKKPRLYQARGGLWKLTTTERKRILLTHLYGVDIDQQAVEVTKLSLLLKVLEDEQSVISQLSLFREQVLPDLENNIKCGNSLIGNDFYAGQPQGLLDEETLYRVNAFDWQKGFAVVMKSGGFDAVIGNPPYGATVWQEETGYLAKQYPNTLATLESYILFLEKGLKLLKQSGLLGMIVPNTWTQIFSGAIFRRYLIGKFTLQQIVHFTYKVFPRVTVDCEIVVVKNIEPHHNQITITISSLEKEAIYQVKQSTWIAKDGDILSVLQTEESEAIFKKIEAISKSLSCFCEVKNGVKPFEVGKGKPAQTKKVLKDKPYVSIAPKDETFKPLLRGSLISRYRNLWNGDYWISYGSWLAAPRDPSIFFDVEEKIVVRQTGDGIIATLIDNQFVCRDNLHILILKDGMMNLKYLLGLLNSRLINYYYRTMNPEKGEVFAQVKAAHLKRLPIRPIDFNNPIDQATHDYLVKLVTQILDLNKRLVATMDPHGKTVLKRQIEAIDEEIDKVVYEVYDLTAEEIKMVENNLVG